MNQAKKKKQMTLKRSVFKEGGGGHELNKSL